MIYFIFKPKNIQLMSARTLRGVFRTLSNIYDGACYKSIWQPKVLKSSQKVPSEISGKTLNTSLTLIATNYWKWYDIERNVRGKKCDPVIIYVVMRRKNELTLNFFFFKNNKFHQGSCFARNLLNPCFLRLD